jgi:hypothetical protein
VQAASVFVWQTHASARCSPTSISRMSRVDDQSPSCSRTTRHGASLPTRLSPFGNAVTCGAIVSNLIDVVLAEGILRKPKTKLPFKMPCGIEPMTPTAPKRLGSGGARRPCKISLTCVRPANALRHQPGPERAAALQHNRPRRGDFLAALTTLPKRHFDATGYVGLWLRTLKAPR